MGGTGRAGRFFTIVIVPHSDGEVVSFRLPILAAQVLCTLVAAFWIGLLVFVNSYLDMLSLLDEVFYLRAATREHEQRLQELSRQAATVERELAQLAELDRRVRQLLRDAPFTRAAPRSGTAGPELAAAGGVLGLGAAGGGLGGGLAPDLAELERRLWQLNDEAVQRSDSLEQLLRALREQQQAYDATPTLWPVRGILTSDFGWRRDPFSWRRDFHAGVDIAAPYGAPVVAAAAGRVVFTGWEGALGLVVVVDHGDYVTRYGHLSRVAVQPGQQVDKGQLIAYVGSTGRSTGPHLHYEVYLQGRLMNPRHFLSER